MKRRVYLLLGLALTLLLGACVPVAAPVAPAAAAPTAEGTPQASLVRLAIPADEGTLTPYTYVTGYPGYYLLKLMYDSLLELDADNIPQPWLAESMDVSEDGTVYTFTLREGVQWQDGQALTAEDVKFTYEYLVQYPEQSRFLRTANQMTSIETPDARTVVMTLAQANPSFPLQAADVPIMPQHIWAEVTEPGNFADATGSGPYRLAEYQPEQFYRLVANADYFMGKPAVAEIVIPIIVEQSTMFSALQSGEIDAASRPVPPELVQEFESNSNLALMQGAGFSTTLFQFNDERPPFDDATVRRAVSLAIDKQALVDTLLLGFGTVGNPGFVHPSSPFVNSELAVEFDPEAARSLLEEAGYSDSDGDGVRETPTGEPMSYAMLVHANNPERIRAAELIRDGVAKIGIEFTIKTLDPNTVVSLVWPDFDVSKGRDFDVSMWGWSASVQTDPGRLSDLIASDPAVGALNIGGYNSAAADALVETLRTTLDPEARLAIIQEMQAVFAQDVPFVPLYYADGIYVFRPAAYDGYVFVKGLGIVNKYSFIAP